MKSFMIAGTAALALALTSGAALAADNTTPGQQPYQYSVGNGAAPLPNGQRPYQYSVGNGAAPAQNGQRPYQYDVGNGAAKKNPGGHYTQGTAGDQQSPQKNNQ